MSFHPRRILTTEGSRKRKEREGFYPTTSSKPLGPPSAVNSSVRWGTTSLKGAELPPPSPSPPLASNRLLAGYMAYEYLTKGTLLGQKFEADPVNWTRQRPSHSQSQHTQTTSEAEPSGKLKVHGYAEVAHLLRSNEAHIPGIVNPTQLARWIQM